MRQVLPFSEQCRPSIEKNRDPQLLPDSPAQPPRQGDASIHRCSLEGHEGNHVRRAHARVLALVVPQVYLGAGRLRRLEGSLENGLGTAYDGEDGPVVKPVGVDVEEMGSSHAPKCFLQRPDDPGALAFAEVGNTLDDAGHHAVSTRVRSQECSSALPATMAPCRITMAEPARSVTTPPASRMMREPAATS